MKRVVILAWIAACMFIFRCFNLPIPPRGWGKQASRWRYNLDISIATNRLQLECMCICVYIWLPVSAFRNKQICFKVFTVKSASLTQWNCHVSALVETAKNCQRMWANSRRETNLSVRMYLCKEIAENIKISIYNDSLAYCWQWHQRWCMEEHEAGER